MGHFNSEIDNRTNPMETAAGRVALEMRNENVNTLVEWAKLSTRVYQCCNNIIIISLI